MKIRMKYKKTCLNCGHIDITMTATYDSNQPLYMINECPKCFSYNAKHEFVRVKEGG